MRPIPCIRRAARLSLLLLPAACAAPPASTPAPRWVETRLFFGLDPATDAPPARQAADSRFQAFLDRSVTPRFPSGLSVQEAYGQWQDAADPGPEQLRSRVLLIERPDDPDGRARIEAIREDWKRLTGDRSVLEVEMPVRVSF